MSNKSNKYYSLRSFLSYLSNYKARLALVFITFVVSSMLLALIPVFIGKLVGVLSSSPVDSSEAYKYVWLLIACSIGHDSVWRLGEFFYMKFLIPVARKYENIVFKHVIQKPYPYFVDKFTGKISAYIEILGHEMRDFTEKFFWSYANQLASLISVSIILTAVNWETGVVFIIAMLMMILVGYFTIRNSAKYEKRLADVASSKNGKIIDAIANFVNVKSFQKEAVETASINEEQLKTIAAAKKSFIWGMVFWGSMSFFVRILIWPITIALNVYLYLNNIISIAELTTLIVAILMFTTFIWEIIWDISQFNLKLARIDEAHNYLFGKNNIAKIKSSKLHQSNEIKKINNSLTMNNLSFSYPDQKSTEVLSNINVSIKNGEKVGIVGKSGSGKTTITKLLLGYYPLKSDTLLLDNSQVDNQDLARIISYVPQDTSLFHRSISDNIAYATDKDVTRGEIINAAKQAHADEFISQIAQGYDTLVGERGVKLSAGQRQRIAIARAFLDNKPILILDEATSALDSESEILVQRALENLWKNKTVIAIAHRLSTLRHMDRIIVMNNGKIIEEGTHTNLLQQRGKYAELWKHQSGGFLEG